MFTAGDPAGFDEIILFFSKSDSKDEEFVI